MNTTVQKIFRQDFEFYSKNKKLPLHQYKAANDFINCRTAAMGGHIQACPEGHVERISYNSCRHRNCPQCNKIQIERWLDRKKNILLDTAHRHLVFTLPHELNELWLMNSSLMTDILFQTASETLKQLLNDKKYLGADTGFLLNLHTWGRNLSLHPHLHCLISNGGLSAQGDWVQPVKKCFLPYRVIMRLFRGKFCAALKRHADLIRKPDNLPPVRFNNLVNQLGRKDWHVEIMEPYEHGEGVINYLARYVKGGPITNQQLDEADDRILLRYQSHQTGQREVHRYSKAGFIRQLLIHVPDRGKRTLRFYGLYTSGKRMALNKARAVHQQAPVSHDEEPENWQDYLISKGYGEQVLCPVCQQKLQQKERLFRGRDPTTQWVFILNNLTALNLTA
ncbi:IS91 family transposase [Endozoicomonas arenosclerae]|uniref:IS91 family transposase n=2 Tax=Endozoicomonas arenosclerae TaxID=1633495 RepID=UPI001561342E|nr:transposase [Endozoicomonas arenosclerae]